jgi:hypothetical protein
MSRHISDSERERMEEFARTPVYKREPDQLLPDEDEEDEEE